MPEKETEVHYWAVECEEQKGWIQLLRVRDVAGKLHLNWPENLEVDCPFCRRHHLYIRQEIEVHAGPVGLPLSKYRPADTVSSSSLDH